jgi:hypothetical protein
MTYVCPAWEFMAETYLLKLQHLQNKVLRSIGSFPRCTSVRDIHVAFQIQYVYDYITKLCRQQIEVIQNHENEKFTIFDKVMLDTGNTKVLNLVAVGHVYDRSSV